MARASGGANIMHPLSWGYKQKKSQFFLYILEKKQVRLKVEKRFCSCFVEMSISILIIFVSFDQIFKGDSGEIL